MYTRSQQRRVVVRDEEGPPAGRRIRLSVGWANSTGQSVEPAELTVWKFREEDQP